MRTSVLLFFGFLICASCTTDRVKTEFGDLNKLLSETSGSLEPKLKPGLEADRQKEITAAANAGDTWFLSDDCNFTLDGDNIAIPATNCSVTKVPFGERAPVIGEATAAQRKLDTLQAYVASLELLMDAKLEEDLVAAYSAALAAFGNLGEASSSLALIEFVKGLQSDQEKTSAVVSEAIATLRYNRMRSVVLASDKDVATVSRELQVHMINLGVDPEFLTKRERLRQANIAVLEGDTSNTTEYRRLLVALEEEHKGFMDFYQGTEIYNIGLVARAHSTLTNALRSNGSTEDILSYLESLKALSDKLGE